MRSLRDAFARLRASLLDSIGDVTFGMEDGAVSIAGLVFGVAASTNDAQIVVLAGATGAVAGAVSMMAGTYLDVHSERSLATAQVADARTALVVGLGGQPSRASRGKCGRPGSRPTRRTRWSRGCAATRRPS